MKNLLLLLVITFASYNANAQGFLRKLEEKAKAKTTDRIERKVDQKMDEALDKVLEKNNDDTNEYAVDDDSSNTNESSGSGYQKLQNKLLKKALGSSSCDVQQSYSFNHNYLMEVVNSDKKGKKVEIMKIRIYTGETMAQLGYYIEENSESPESEGSTILMNEEDSSMVMLINANGIKSGFCNKNYVVNYSQSAEQADEAEENMEGWKKTGRTKMILGKTCYEHISTAEGVDQTAWVANDGASMSEIMKSMANNPSLGMSSGLNSPFGLVMEMITKDPKTGETSTMKILELNENQTKKISTAGYSFF